MNKKYFLFIFVLALVIGVLSLSLYSIKFSSANTCIIDVTKSSTDSSLYSFDVSDFSGASVNTIDIPSISYDYNQVSVRGSDFKISDELNAKIIEAIQSYGASSSFYIVSLNDGMSIGYNVDKQYETASSIKAPYALYVYEEIAKGNINPDQEFEYTQNLYNKGTGIIKNSEFGTKYNVRQLVYYSLTESDNVAHTMLHRAFGVSGYNKMLDNLGTSSQHLTISNPWGFTTARSSAIVWQEIYNFAIRETEGINFLNILSSGKYNYYKEVMPSLPSASKTGFANSDVLTTGIVFGDQPYIAIAIANKGGNLGAYTQVLKLITLMNDVMNEYNDYLSN